MSNINQSMIESLAINDLLPALELPNCAEIYTPPAINSTLSSGKECLERDETLGNENNISSAAVSYSQATLICGGMAAATTLAPPLPVENKHAKIKQPSPPPTNHWSPSLQNVLDQPAAALPLKILLGGIIFCIAFVSWAMLGSIDEVGHAQGRLVPKGEVYTISPLDLGKVAKVAVKEGKEIKRGEVLVELDTQLAADTVKRFQQELVAFKTEFTQKQQLLEKVHLEADTKAAIAKAELQSQQAALTEAQQKVATTQKILNYLQTDADAYAMRREQLKPLTITTNQLLKQLQVDLVASQQRLERLKPLVEIGAIAREQLFQVEQTIRDRQRAIIETQLQQSTNTKEQIFQSEQNWRERLQSITQTKGELVSAMVEFKRLQVGLAQKKAEVQAVQLKAQQQIQGMEVELTQLKAKISQTNNLLHSAQEKLKQRFLYAPIDGVVSSLNIRNPGEVVQAGQTIAEVAPENAPLVLLGKLPNNQVGSVKVGMPVKVKLDAYPYQDYGIVEGKVTSISPDSKPDPQLGAVYQVEVALNPNSSHNHHRDIKFKAGQTASADIITRHRRIADLLLDPVKQIQTAGLDL